MKTFSKLSAYAMIALLAVTTWACSKDDDKEGASGYFYHEGHSYLIVKELKTWADAAADAVSKGGYLVEIGNQAEQDAVYQGVVAAKISASYAEVVDGGGIAYIWIGANDRTQEDGWIWNGANTSGTFPLFWLGNNTGSAVGGAFANWGGKAAGSFNEPDNFTDSQYAPNGQDAAAIGLANWPEGSSASNGLGRAGEWNDIADSNKIYYIIEFDSKKE